MNKNFLLLALAALMMVSAGAQAKGPAGDQPARALTQIQPQVFTQEMKVDEPSENVLSPRRSSGPLDVYYRRPAGAFYSPFLVVDGVGLFNGNPDGYVLMKPFSSYTYYGYADGADGNDIFYWNGVEYGTCAEPISVVESFGNGAHDAPLFSVLQNGDPEQVYSFRYPHVLDSYNNPFGGIVVSDDGGATIVAVTDCASYYGDETVDFLLSSKTMAPGGRTGDQVVPSLSSYYGAKPWGDNTYGWWFGKNASHVDGMAQAFEKPEHPYLLKNVYLQTDYNGMVVDAPVKMTCKVYKLDEIPAYQENGGATLPVEPGELIVTGEATVSPTTGKDNYGLITFTLYDHDVDDPDLTFECQPTIDYPILVCIDGYNDEGMEDLVDFRAYVSTDDQVDEGYGELAYLKQGIFEYEYDENGDTAFDDAGNPIRHFTGEYYWKGLNNYFGQGTRTMKTGLSIFIGVDQPYITYQYGFEDGEYRFPDVGGMLTDTFEYSGGLVTTHGIEFLSSSPSADDDWSMTCWGDDLPAWLEIELVDGETDGEFDGRVTAMVHASPLPQGIIYREAVVRFAIPGDYRDFKFMQGALIVPRDCDVNGDGEVNIADVNCLIDIILGHKDAAEFDGRADVDLDQEVNIADVNMVIAAILGHI